MSLVLALLLSSPTFKDGAAVPLTMVAPPCGGSNLSPALTWSGAPRGTRSFALIARDPDASRRGFVHWVVYDIPPSQTAIAAGAAFSSAVSGRNDAGSLGYFGPCPPPGKVHHYVFTLYALDVPAIDAGSPLGAREVEERMHGHILARASYTGLRNTTGEGER